MNGSWARGWRRAFDRKPDRKFAMALRYLASLSSARPGLAAARRLLIPALFLPLLVGASELLPARLYDVTIETGMPHLEENLRYTTTHRRRCISLKDLATEFPILDHPTLAGCALGGAARNDDTLKFGLICDNRHGTTGAAIWHIDKQHIRGRLDVKLGGKNMTFSQTVTARVVGSCPKEPG
jgi:hypothetical protein